MDSFTENILARARERQKLLEGYNGAPVAPKTTLLKDRNALSPKASSQPNLGASPKRSDRKEVSSEPNLSKSKPEFKENQSEGNFSKFTRQTSTTRVSSEITSSPQSLKTLNIKNDNFNMEIKVSSVDNVRVEVQIEEREGGDDDEGGASPGLREDARKRLNRLGQLYAGGEDAGISSPIHRTEAKFELVTPASEIKESGPKSPRKGLKKLADLADNINHWEDDLKCLRKSKPEQSSKKIWKPPAPQPPEETPKSSPVKPLKNKAPNPPKIVSESPKKETGKLINTWDQKVLDSLESQGFTRTASSSKLIYKYDSEAEKDVKTASTTKIQSGSQNAILEEEEIEEKSPVKIEKSPTKPKSPVKTVNKSVDVAKRAAIFESGSPSKPTATKDPALLSVSERKALFEKNKGAALVPKAAFAMAVPTKSDPPRKVRVKSPAPKPPIGQKPKENQVESKPQLQKIGKKPEVEAKPVVPQSTGIAHTVAALFESKNTISSERIENEIREQRRKDMDMLCNRFNRPINEEPEIEEVDDLDDVTEETAMIKSSVKAPKVVPPPPPPPVASSSGENRKSGGNKRCSKNDSPKVAAVLNDVKRIKVSPKKAGRLYPSLTDIESATETELDTDHNPSHNNSSFEESFAESDEVNTSFGRDVLRTVCQNDTPHKRIINDSSSSDNMSDLLDGMDDYIDEALAYDEAQGPTPPKIGKPSPKNVAQPSNSFNYKNCKLSEFQSPSKSAITPRKSELPTYVVEGDNVMPLTHTVSFYRKQQNLSASNTPVRQISRQAISSSHNNPPQVSHSNERHLVDEKIKQLHSEVQKQQMIISQTSQALNLCNSTPEFMGSTEQVEAERVLLVATHRRQAAHHELQRLEVEKSLRPQGHHSRNLPLEKGTLTISNIVVPLKQKYVTALAAAGGMGHHVVCLIKCGEQVAPTQLVSTVASNRKNLEMDLRIPGKIKLENIYSDFTITFEVYCLQAQEELLPHDVKYHIKKPNGSKGTPKKSKQDSRLVRPIKESPAGPHAVRSPTFALMGYVVFAVQAINKKHWTLNNTPSMSPLEGTVEMVVSCELAMSVEHRGFLTMFEDVSGFGAWHRRWCLLKGHTLSYWKYPDDERKTPPIDSINLKNCLTTETGPVSRDICARLHTFLLERERVAHPQDRDTLVTIRKGDKTIIRHLLSADTKEERVEWCNKFNAALTAVRMWGDK